MLKKSGPKPRRQYVLARSRPAMLCEAVDRWSEVLTSCKPAFQGLKNKAPLVLKEMDGTCFSCERKNGPEHVFCSSCGSPLSLSSYVAKQVDNRLAETTRDKEFFERESAILIFEKVFGWAKLVSGIGAALLAILAVGATWRFLDLRSAVSQAETAVGKVKSSAEKQIYDTAETTRGDISKESTDSVHAIRMAAKQATASSTQAQTIAKVQGVAITKQASDLTRDFQGQAMTVTKDVVAARQQIQAASELQPQMTALQQQLAVAQAQITQQQHVITSSEDFAKTIFGSYRRLSFDRSKESKDAFAVIPYVLPQKPQAVALYILLPDAPLLATVAIQFNQTVAAAQSYTVFHNLLVIFIGKIGEEELLGKPVAINYFPDPDDKVRLGALTTKDGRVFSGGDGLPKFGQADPDFKGSKWVALAPVQNPATPPPAIPTPKSQPR